jgi:prevent-host-death family protein
MAAMPKVNVHQAKTQLSRLLAEAAAGREVIIARDGKPVARLVSISEEPVKRKPGCLKGRLRIARDFDSVLPDDVQAAFEGRR